MRTLTRYCFRYGSLCWVCCASLHRRSPNEDIRWPRITRYRKESKQLNYSTIRFNRFSHRSNLLSGHYLMPLWYRTLHVEKAVKALCYASSPILIIYLFLALVFFWHQKRKVYLSNILVIFVVFRLISDELSVIKVHMMFKLVLMRNSWNDRGVNDRRKERKPRNGLLTLFE
jgi:hypothetical protein